MGLNDEQIIIILPTTSPNRKLSDISKGMKLFEKNKHDIIIAVTESTKNPYFNMLEKKETIYNFQKKIKRNFL